MVWVIAFIISWLIFLFLVDFKQLPRTIYGGLFTLILGIIVDWGGQRLEFYKFYDPVIGWNGCSVFYLLGPVFNMGVIFAQYLPRDRVLKVINIVVSSGLYLVMELLVVKTGTARYIHWHYLASLVIDLAAFTSLTWLAEHFNLHKRRWV